MTFAPQKQYGEDRLSPTGRAQSLHEVSIFFGCPDCQHFPLSSGSLRG